MSVRKRSWKSPQGEVKEAWVVNYTDGDGIRRLKSFERKRDADMYHATVKTEIRAGTHTADSKSPTVAEAGQLWLQTGENAKLERTTLDYYRQHLDLHIVPLLGNTKLSQLTVPMVRAFEDKLRADRSPAMVRKAARSVPSWPTGRNGAWWRRTSCVTSVRGADQERSAAPINGKRASSRLASIFRRQTRSGRGFLI
jgi:hypothetical protein